MFVQAGSLVASNIYRTSAFVTNAVKGSEWLMSLCLFSFPLYQPTSPTSETFPQLMNSRTVAYRPLSSHNSHNGNKILLGIISANLVIFGLNKLYFIYRNQSKAAKWDRLTIEEKDAYLEANPNAGNKR